MVKPKLLEQELGLNFQWLSETLSSFPIFTKNPDSRHPPKFEKDSLRNERMRPSRVKYGRANNKTLHF